MKDLVFVLTGAHAVSNDLMILRERSVEYRIGLSRVATFSKQMYGIVSEIDNSLPFVPPFSQFSFEKIQQIPKSYFPSDFTKSQREFTSIQALLPELEANKEIDDKTFIVKVTGRYILIKDTFINSVQAEANNPASSIDILLRLAPMSENGIQMFTFLYAMRYKWFKQLFSKSPYELGKQNIEKFMIQFIAENALCAMPLNSLDILTNINNEGKYTVY